MNRRSSTTRHAEHPRPETDPQADQAFDRWVDDMDHMLGEVEGFFAQEQRHTHRHVGHRRAGGRAA